MTEKQREIIHLGMLKAQLKNIFRAFSETLTEREINLLLDEILKIEKRIEELEND